MWIKTTLAISMLTLSLCLSACGTGGDSSTATASSAGASSITTTTPSLETPSSAPRFSTNIFAPREEFEALCATPRTGVDPDGFPFQDGAGSERTEKFWLRSWTEETYLWNDEVIDQDPDNFNDRVPYFDSLRTFELSETGSGRERDDFHFSEDTEDFFARRDFTATATYGARFVFANASPPRDVRVLYTEPRSPAAALQNGVPAFPRGTRLLSVDGIDIINSPNVSAIENALFPPQAGASHSFTVMDAGTSTPRTVTLTAANISEAPVNRTEIIQTETGRVGYMLFNTFSPFEAETSLNNAITQLAREEVDDLVLDLRYNGGGLVTIAAQLGYMIAGPQRTRGRTAALLQYNDAANGRDPITGARIDPIPFIDQGVGFSVPANTPLATLNLPRVFILSTEATCSASELIINSLRGIGFEVILIGDTTCGKPYGFLPTDNCGRTYYTIQFRSLNDAGFGDYSDGFSPADSANPFSEKTAGCTVADDLSQPLGDPNEALLSAALRYRSTGSCPAPVSLNVASSSVSAAPSLSSRPSGTYAKRFAAPNTADALNPQGDPFETTPASYLDATRPK